MTFKNFIYKAFSGKAQGWGCEKYRECSAYLFLFLNDGDKIIKFENEMRKNSI
jgi:hypothetical protein